MLTPLGSFEKPAGHRLKPGLWVVCPRFGDHGQPWLWRQVTGLETLDIEVVCWTRSNAEIYPAKGSTVNVMAGEAAPYNGRGRWLHRLRNLAGGNFYGAVGSEKRQLGEMVQKRHPAAILGYFGETAMRVLPVARRWGIPVIAYLHGEYQFNNNRWYRWSLLRCLRQFAAFIVVTEGELRWLRARGVPAEKIHLIPCGVPTEIFRPAPHEYYGVSRFVMVSRLVAEKGCHYSIAAFAKVVAEFPGSQLHIYGDGVARPELEAAVRNLRLESQVVFHGYVPEQLLAGELPSYDVFIQHSLEKEGSPVSIAEAMACGLPVVATPVGGIVDQVLEGVTGLLVDERDVKGMAQAMCKLAGNDILRRSLGENARKHVLKLYDSKLLTQRLERVVMAVISGSPV